jgi:hypothetical protein
MDQDILGNIGGFAKRCFEVYCGHLGGLTGYRDL